MALTIETLEIVIEHKASEASQRIDALTKSLSNMKRILSGSSKVFDNVGAGLDTIGKSINSIDVTRLTALAEVLDRLKGLKTIPKSIQKGVAGVANATSGIISTAEADDNAPGYRKTLMMSEKLKKGIEALGNAGKEAGKPINKLFKSLARIAMYRAVRSFISGITKAIKEGIQNLYQFDKLLGGELSKSLDELSTSAQYIKNSFAVAIAPIIQMIMPLLENAAQAIADFANGIAVLNAKSKGLSTVTIAAKDMKEFAENAQKAKSAIMGFDELNSISSSNSITGMFEEIAIDDTVVSDFKQKVADITGIISMSLFALGLLVTLIGHPIIGIGMMIAGGALGYKVAIDWGKEMTGKLKETLAEIIGIVSFASLAIGLIFLFVPGFEATGIGLLLAGGVGLGLSVALNWDYLPDKLKTLGASLLSIVSGLSTVVGFLLLFTPGFRHVGLGLLLAGIETSQYGAEIDDNALTNWIAERGKAAKKAVDDAWEGIRQLFTGEKGIREFFGDIPTWLHDDILQPIIDFIESLPNEIKSPIQKLFNWVDTHIISPIRNFFNVTLPELFSWGTNEQQGKKVEEYMAYGLKGGSLSYDEWEKAGYPKDDLSSYYDSQIYQEYLNQGGDLPYGKWKALRGYSTGGFPEDGLFFANHNELVGRFTNGRTAVANNDQIVEGISAGVYDAVVSALSDSGQGNKPLNLNVYLDGKQIRSAVNEMNYAAGARIATGGIQF